MKNIIIYATRYGCTAEVAKRIQKELESDSTLVNIMAEKVPPLDSFETVILGGSIYIGKVQKELTSFVNANLKQLLSKKSACFSAPERPSRKIVTRNCREPFRRSYLIMPPQKMCSATHSHLKKCGSLTG